MSNTHLSQKNPSDATLATSTSLFYIENLCTKTSKEILELMSKILALQVLAVSLKETAEYLGLTFSQLHRLRYHKVYRLLEANYRSYLGRTERDAWQKRNVALSFEYEQIVKKEEQTFGKYLLKLLEEDQVCIQNLLQALQEN